MILYDKLTKVFNAQWFLLKYNGGTFCNHTIFRLDTHHSLTYLCAVTLKQQ